MNLLNTLEIPGQMEMGWEVGLAQRIVGETNRTAEALELLAAAAVAN